MSERWPDLGERGTESEERPAPEVRDARTKHRFTRALARFLDEWNRPRKDARRID